MFRSIVLGAALAALSFAAPINSGAGLKVEVFNDGTNSYDNVVGGTVLLTGVHPAWAPEVNGAEWISYAQTGNDQPNAVLPASTTNARMRVYHDFSLASAGLLNLIVWADDTTGVYLSNGVDPLVTLFAPNTGQNTCAPSAIGCQPGEEGILPNYALAAGNYTLRFDVYQVGTDASGAANPMGLLYVGSADASAVPEPGTWALLASGIALLGARRYYANR